MRYFEKQSKKKKWIYPAIGVPAGMITLGAIGGTLFPGLRGGKGKLLGSLVATKRIFADAPYSLITKKDFLSKKLFNTEKAYMLKLSPQEIINKNMSQAPETAKTLADKYVATKHLNFKSALDTMREQENIARTQQATKMVGASHFTPQQAAMLGYMPGEEINPKVLQHLAGTKLYGWYPKLRRKTFKKVLREGLGSLDANDVYPLAADTKTLKLYTKDLTIPHETAVKRAKENLNKISPEVLNKAKEDERVFNKKYNSLLLAVLKGKE